MILPKDERLRLVAAFVLVAALSQVEDIRTAALALGVACLVALIERTNRRLWRRLLHVEGFVLLLFLSLPFSVAGTPLFSVGPLTATVEGAIRAGLVACKVSASVLIVMTLLGPIEPTRIGAAMQALRVPDTIVRLFVTTVRYLSILREEALRLHESMRARAFSPRSNRHTWRSYGYLIGMLLVRALERGKRVEEAMLCRGFSGRFLHTALPAPAVGDWIGFSLLAALSVVMLISGWP
ncbi:cobalt ECF transporter T component CbiQ [Amorphus sp. 3PC139-8]|uniref:cobalt ECF transporter T component CbiQ n=1 Tax=Amorphus sp. 3PC139-8 TaxID=2735676 RepID=UPI00345CF0F3